jgi:hypothetical protein
VHKLCHHYNELTDYPFPQQAKISKMEPAFQVTANKLIPYDDDAMGISFALSQSILPFFSSQQ